MFPTPCNDALPVKMGKNIIRKTEKYIIIIVIIFLLDTLVSDW
jgi:hypothetical protein